MEGTQELGLTQMRNSALHLGSSTEFVMDLDSFIEAGRVIPKHDLTMLGNEYEEKYGDPALMRFLVARSMDPEKAAKMFVKWQKWRASFVPDGFIPESEVQDELATRKIFLQSLSRTGHPLLLAKASRHFPAKGQPQFKRREIGDEKLVGILYLQHITYKNIDAHGLITGFQFLQIVIITNEGERRDFMKEVREEALPEEFGGRGKLVAIQEVVLPPLES